MKRCCRCREYKSVNQFSRNRTKHDGLMDSCKPCRTIEQREWRRKHPIRAWASGLRDGGKGTWRRPPPPLDLQMLMSLYPKDGLCPVFKVPFSLPGNGQSPYSATIDHLDGDKNNWSLSNLRVISRRANSIKSNASLDEVRKLLAWMEIELDTGQSGLSGSGVGRRCVPDPGREHAERRA